MKALFTGLLGRAADLAQTQPLLALCLGAAMLTLLSSQWRRLVPAHDHRSSLVWTLYSHLTALLLAAALALAVLQAFALLRTYVRRAVAHFQQKHGRVTEANYNAVQTIWGSEQTQRDLTVHVFYEEEITERTEFEDPARSAIIRRKTVTRTVAGNPFVAESHQVTLKQNPRRKGSALYGGYETECRFSWKLKSPATRATRGTLRFPLPAQGAMYDDLHATLNGSDILPKIELNEAALVYTRDLEPGEELDLTISFTSRGMSQWYFQVAEQREIRDLALIVSLPDLPQAKLNYPEGCMSPTEIKASADGRGSVLSYRLEHAISHKGMGIVLPTLPQPGAATNAVLGEAERGWTLGVAVVLLGTTIRRVRWAALVTLLFAAMSALAFGLLGDFSDLLLGFWGTAALVFLPLLLVLIGFIHKLSGRQLGRLAGGLLIVFCVAYPIAAGLDADRQTLYFNLSVMLFLIFAALSIAQSQKIDDGPLT